MDSFSSAIWPKDIPSKMNNLLELKIKSLSVRRSEDAFVFSFKLISKKFPKCAEV